MKWLILFLGIMANASASLLVKIAMTPPRKFPTLTEPLAIFSNWPFWLGLSLYGIAFLLYASSLARLPLSVAHPILTVGAILAVAICSGIIFKEDFSWTTIMGFVCIIIGIVLIAVSATNI